MAMIVKYKATCIRAVCFLAALGHSITFSNFIVVPSLFICQLSMPTHYVSRSTGYEHHKPTVFFHEFVLSVCMLLCCTCTASDNLKPGDILRFNETLVSFGGVFQLGFFSSIGSSASNHYLGIWFRNDKQKKAVWVANREQPALDDTCYLSIRNDGKLVITDRRLIPIIINYDASASAANNISEAKIFDSGNFILKAGEKILWQSFDHPSDTFLPGMKLGWLGLNTEQLRKHFLVSWVSPYFPFTGPFTLGLMNTSLYVWYWDMSREIGFWDGHDFKFFFKITSENYKFMHVIDKNDIYLTFETRGRNMSYFVLTADGEIHECTLLDQGINVIKHKLCKETSGRDDNACLIPQTSTMCPNNEKFSENIGSMPKSMTVINASTQIGLVDCEVMCRSNCSCAAYASFQDDGTGCELYYGKESDLQQSIGKGNITIYVRGDITTCSVNDLTRKRKLVRMIVIPTVCVVILTMVSLLYYLSWKRRKDTCKDDWKDHDVPLISFSSIVKATDNFAAHNKIGEGGFGPVYKGKFQGHDVAVKRLSKGSEQGVEEFMSEVRSISQLRHNNCVKLLGYCIQRKEKILVYDYMENGSLSSFIFDKTKRTKLDWRTRMTIIQGIAQGILYIHKDSRLRIIHRDLKMSNILLDNTMNPKISDFGMARIVDISSWIKTRKIVGTLGYMSPEYVVHGQYSTKTDVFSFGVIILEIISGRKNTMFYELNCSLNLLGYAWEMSKNGRFMEFMDPTLVDSYVLEELVIVLHVGLLCVQEHAQDRPSISEVVQMLSCAGVSLLPTPKPPAFTTHSSIIETNLVQKDGQLSFNDVTHSGLKEGR